jgi:cysteinyl-tRNA synthetase
LKEVAPDASPLDRNEDYALRFADAMNDDFNTPLAVAVLFELANEVNRTKSAAQARQLKGLAGILGLLERAPQQFLQAGAHDAADAVDEAYVLTQIAARTAAKKSKNFAEADKIRGELSARGVVLEDKPDGSTEWRRA